MSSRKATCRLVAFYIGIVFVIGCLPENSLEWADDGSVGLLRVHGGLCLIDGETGELTPVENGVDLLPDISKDGKWIAYSERVSCDSLSEGLKLLPPSQVKMIKYYAEKTRKNILDAGGLTDARFPFPEEGLLLPEDYRNWAIRYLCENAGSEFREVLGNEGIEKAGEKAIVYSRIVVAPRENLAQRRVVAVNVFKTMATKLSPDAKSVAYLMHTQEGEVNNAPEEYGLYVASMDTDVKTMYVDSRVAFGYDWRDDGRAIAYLSASSENLGDDDLDPALGTLSETVVADANGTLLAEEADVPEHGSAGTHRCAGKLAELAGALVSPWLKVEYGRDNRVFFSSYHLSLPASRRDDPGCSLFCYDPITGVVTDALPSSVSIYTGQQIFALSQFALSPDGKHVLLPIERNRFIAHKLGTKEMEFVIPEEEVFGDEDAPVPELAPSFKGKSAISFLVSGNSKFLSKSRDGREQADRRDIVIFEEGESWVLSENWHDEILGADEGDK